MKHTPNDQPVTELMPVLNTSNGATPSSARISNGTPTATQDPRHDQSDQAHAQRER